MLNNRKSYAFDFDSNLVFTKDTIFLLKRNWKSWHQIELSQQQFDQIQIDGKNRKRLNDNRADSLVNFLKTGNYKNALLDALYNDQTWPARWGFLEANESASPTAIITARGQAPQELKDSHRAVIYDILTMKQRQNLVENMKKRLKVKLNNNQAIELYLNNNLYLPVESKEFLEMSWMTTNVPTKIRKHFGLEMFVWHVQSLFEKYYWKDFLNNLEFSVWFSDDNLQNVESMKNFIKSDFLSKYPNVKFVVYDTNDIKNVKRFKIR